MTAAGPRRFTQIGIDRLVRLEWLERTAALSLAGAEPEEIKRLLQSELIGSFRSANTNVRGSLDKTLTVLMKIWVRPPGDLNSLRDRGLELINKFPRREHIAIHWGMIMAVYPFWSAVAAQVGRLLRLQGTVRPAQVQRRLREQYGERETVSRRVRYVLRSFVDWKVLRDTDQQGVAEAGASFSIEEPELVVWLLEAALCTIPEGSAPLRSLLHSTSLFPFRISWLASDYLARQSDRLEIVRHGLDQDLVILRQWD